MSLYASVVRLDRAAVQSLKITDLYSLHRVVYGLFDDVRSETEKQASKSSGIQWVDKGGDRQYRQLLLLSDRLPRKINEDWVESKPVPDGFLLYRQYWFTITISPTQRDNQSRKLKPIKGRQAIADWFIERAAARWGFIVDPAQLQVDAIKVQQCKNKVQHLITLQQATLSGHLTVSDPERFQTSFKQGLGRGRSFGCGLLQIAPILESPFFDKE